MMTQDATAPSLLVFSDLDGSLMDHDSYSIEPARVVLQRLFDDNIPLVLSSSKTRMEMLGVQERLHLDTSFVCENGAALHLCKASPPRQAPIEFGPPRNHWLAQVHQLRETRGWRFDGFADWSVQAIMNMTGLDAQQAEWAGQREYSEPILWRDSASALTEFEEALTTFELQLMEGGRFYSIQGRYDKGDAMRYMRSRYAHKEPVITVALGDSPNDTAMLQQADIAVVIRSAKSDKIKLESAQRIIRTERAGPLGWQDAMDEIMRRYGPFTLASNQETLQHG